MAIVRLSGEKTIERTQYPVASSRMFFPVEASQRNKYPSPPAVAMNFLSGEKAKVEMLPCRISRSSILETSFPVDTSQKRAPSWPLQAEANSRPSGEKAS